MPWSKMTKFSIVLKALICNCFYDWIIFLAFDHKFTYLFLTDIIHPPNAFKSTVSLNWASKGNKLLCYIINSCRTTIGITVTMINYSLFIHYVNKTGWSPVIMSLRCLLFSTTLSISAKVCAPLNVIFSRTSLFLLS